MAGVVRPDGDGCTLSVKVIPKARKNALEPERDGRLLVRVTAPPADGAANKAVIALVAKSLQVPKSSVSVRAGLSHREKTLAVAGLSAEEAQRRLATCFTQ